jgi:hypothetical protein
MFLLCQWQCHFSCLDFLSFQYIYWHHTNGASFYLFLSEWHVNSCAMIFLVFNTSICVIVTMLPFISKIVWSACEFLCHHFFSFNTSIWVIVTVFPFMLSLCEWQIFHALIFLVLKPPWCFTSSYPIHSPSLGSNFWNHQGNALPYTYPHSLTWECLVCKWNQLCL